jgi:hypothetical protein
VHYARAEVGTQAKTPRERKEGFPTAKCDRGVLLEVLGLSVA